MSDEELRVAIAAFLRSWIRPEWLSQNSEEEFEQLLEVMDNGLTLAPMFRHVHAEHGRYPDLPSHATGLRD